MIEITIPGCAPLELDHLVLDYNGTLGCDGDLLPGVRELLVRLGGHLDIHVVTGDTFGKTQLALTGVPCKLFILPPHDQAAEKLAYIQRLDASRCVVIGNGRNYRLMLQHAVLGIGVIQTEGLAVEAMMAADVVTTDIAAALVLALNPLRLVATLRT